MPEDAREDDLDDDDYAFSLRKLNDVFFARPPDNLHCVGIHEIDDEEIERIETWSQFEPTDSNSSSNPDRHGSSTTTKPQFG